MGAVSLRNGQCAGQLGFRRLERQRECIQLQQWNLQWKLLGCHF